MAQDYNGLVDVRDTYANFSADAASVYELTHDVCSKYVDPIIAEYEMKKAFPQDLWKVFGGAGLSGIGMPQEYGGSEMDIICEFAAIEAMSEHSGAIGLSHVANTALCANQINVFGDKKQKEDYLPGIIAGTMHGGLSITEPDFGSDAFGIRSPGKWNGESWDISLNKTYNTNVKTADVIFAYVNTGANLDDGELTAFLIDKNPKIQFLKNKKESMLSSDTDQMFAENLKIGDDKRVGQRGNGRSIMAFGLPKERTLLSAQSIGLAQGSFNHTLAYLGERKQFGKPLIQFDTIRHQMTDLYREISMTRYAAIAICLQAAKGKNEKDPKVKYQFMQNKHGGLLKNDVGNMAIKVVKECAVLCGGNGLSEDAPHMRNLRDAVLNPIGGGAENICNIASQRDILPKKQPT